jgi:hypothetical protein
MGTSFEGMTCRVVYQGKLTRRFDVKTGVGQDWSCWLGYKDEDRQHKQHLVDHLDSTCWPGFEDDLALIAHSSQQMSDTDLVGDLHLFNEDQSPDVQNIKHRSVTLNGINLDWLFTVLLSAQEFFTYMETSPLPVKGCKICLCSALRASEQGGIFILPHLLWHGTSVFFWSHPKDRPIQSPLTTHEGMWRIYSNPDPHGANQSWRSKDLHILSSVINQHRGTNADVKSRIGKARTAFTNL